jgi:release factor glutamine methyltransferase
VTRGELTTELAASLGQRHEARFIVEEVLGTATPGPGHVVAPADLATARTLAARRRAGEPLQYVLGHWAFRSLDLLVDPRVLIPRPETEQVVEVALHELDHLGSAAPAMVDAGTGSGAIALSLATELADRFPAGRVWATDISAGALDVAKANLARTLEQVNGKMLPVSLHEGSWLRALPTDLRGFLDLVVANPPYVATEEWSGLAGEVQQEPYGALVSDASSEGTRGLADVELVLGQAKMWLARPGAVVIEMAPGQTEAASRLARSMGYVEVRVEQDLARRPRALVGRTR